MDHVWPTSGAKQIPAVCPFPRIRYALGTFPLKLSHEMSTTLVSLEFLGGEKHFIPPGYGSTGNGKGRGGEKKSVH